MYENPTLNQPSDLTFPKPLIWVENFQSLQNSNPLSLWGRVGDGASSTFPQTSSISNSHNDVDFFW